MPAINFLAAMVPAVARGTKLQTIRRSVYWRRWPPGTPLQLYHGLRTSQAIKIRDAVLRDVTYVGLTERGVTLGDASRFPSDIDDFARLDGFADYAEMWAWFAARYDTASFTGFVIRWHP